MEQALGLKANEPVPVVSFWVKPLTWDMSWDLQY